MRIAPVAHSVLLAMLLVCLPALAQERVVLKNSEKSLSKIPFDRRESHSLVLSPDGWHGAYVLRRDGHEWVIINGEPGDAYERVAPDSLVFSPDATRIAFAARLGGRWHVANGEELSEASYNAVVGSSVRYSPDGKRLAFIATRDKRTFVVDGGAEGPAFDAVVDDRLAFSATGRLAYVGARAGRKVVVIDGAESMPFAEASFPVFSGDGNRAAYLASDGARWFVGFDDFARHDVMTGARASTLALSRDGSSFAYAFRSPEGMRVAVGNRGGGDAKPVAGEPVDWVFDGSITFSPDGTGLAYAVRRGDECHVVVDGKPGPPFHGIVPGTIVFSPDGRRYAYVAEQTTGVGALGRTVVVDGTAWVPFERVRGVPRFSPDGRHVACVAEHTFRGLTGQFVVVDGSPGKAYACVRGDPVFNPDGTHVAVMALAPDVRFAAGEELPRLASAGGNDDDHSGRRLVLDQTDADRLGVTSFGRRPPRPPLEVLLVQEQIGHD